MCWREKNVIARAFQEKKRKIKSSATYTQSHGEQRMLKLNFFAISLLSLRRLELHCIARMGSAASAREAARGEREENEEKKNQKNLCQVIYKFAIIAARKNVVCTLSHCHTIQTLPPSTTDIVVVVFASVQFTTRERAMMIFRFHFS